MEIFNITNPQQRLSKIESFIKATNVHPLIYAKEGGVINMDTFLEDFLKYLELIK